MLQAKVPLLLRAEQLGPDALPPLLKSAASDTPASASPSGACPSSMPPQAHRANTANKVAISRLRIGLVLFVCVVVTTLPLHDANQRHVVEPADFSSLGAGQGVASVSDRSETTRSRPKGDGLFRPRMAINRGLLCATKDDEFVSFLTLAAELKNPRGAGEMQPVAPSEELPRRGVSGRPVFHGARNLDLAFGRQAQKFVANFEVAPKAQFFDGLSHCELVDCEPERFMP